MSGNPNAGMEWELRAIAAVVIGGTLLTGGVGYVVGTLLGVLILGLIDSASIRGQAHHWVETASPSGCCCRFIALQR